MNANIYRSIDGSFCGMVENFDADRYENASDNPEGHVQAGSVLEDADCQRLNLFVNERIYALIV
jgi:hypothetical protein